MNLDISKVKFEEAYDNTPFEEHTLYFIAPKDLVKDKHPEADYSTIFLVSGITLDARKSHSIL